jgi:hypothetical protein
VDKYSPDQDALDAARYRLLRCYNVSGHWPSEAELCPGVIAFSARYDDPHKYTLGQLDKLLDEMLGFGPPSTNGPVRSDYAEWRKKSTQSAIDRCSRPS